MVLNSADLRLKLRTQASVDPVIPQRSATPTGIGRVNLTNVDKYVGTISRLQVG